MLPDVISSNFGSMNSLFKELCQPLTASLSVGSCPVQFTWFTGWRLARLGFQLAAGNWQPRDKLGAGWQAKDILIQKHCSMPRADRCQLQADFWLHAPCPMPFQIHNPQSAIIKPGTPTLQFDLCCGCQILLNKIRICRL